MKKIICVILITFCLFNTSSTEATDMVKKTTTIDLNEPINQTQNNSKSEQLDTKQIDNTTKKQISNFEALTTLLIMFLIFIVLPYTAIKKYIKNRKIKKENAKIAEASNVIENAKNEAAQIIKDAKLYQQKASEEAKEIIDKAKTESLLIKKDAEFYEHTVHAMKNIIQGYGNDYIIPSYTLLDELADTYSYTQVSAAYKYKRSNIREMVKNNLAADCDYPDTQLRKLAINFIVDSFNEKVNAIIASAKVDNFGTLKQKLIDAYHLVNYNGKFFYNTHINEEYFWARVEELRLACTLIEIRKKDLEEQHRIKNQIKEEEKAQREIEKAIRNAAKEEEMLRKAMDKVRSQLEQANAEQKAIYEAQIAELESKYREAEERNKRATSMAQQTKSGHVYIISNEGSFGANIYKIGMTRRLEPLDRIKELNSASVPFPFDVHAMIWSEDAPALEHQLHKKFAINQVNKVNFRKEFFKISLSEIRSELEKHDIEVQWTITAKASEYHESLAINKTIQDNQQAREDWLNHQLELENSELIFTSEEENNDEL